MFVYKLSGCRLDSSCSHEKYYCVENALLPILKMFDTVVQQSLAQFFNSHWQDFSTVPGIIRQQSLARLFNSPCKDHSTVTGTIFQQSLARLFNSRWHGYTTVNDSSTVAGATLQQSRWQNFSTVMLTAEESCHVPGI